MTTGSSFLFLSFTASLAQALRFIRNSDANIQDEIDNVVASFGTVDKLCDYWGWAARPADQPRPRIFFGTITGNQDQIATYQTLFQEVYPYVHRLAVLDPMVNFDGTPRNLTFETNSPSLKQFSERLRHVVFETPPWPHSISASHLTAQEKDTIQERFRRPGKQPIAAAHFNFAIEKYQRSEIARGFKNEKGKWGMQNSDIVLIADSDEIPLREALVGLMECMNPTFERVKSRIAKGEDAKAVCAKDAKVLLKSQVFEFYLDCPVKVPVWWHPDAILADCMMNGDIDAEDVRTGSSGMMTQNVAARHVHNLGLSSDSIAHKYTHYSEPNVIGLDAFPDASSRDEMSWRTCDSNAPDIGPNFWHTKLRPDNYFVKGDNGRGYAVPADERVGLDRPLKFLAEASPSQLEHFYWKHAGRSNAWVGKGPGNRTYH